MVVFVFFLLLVFFTSSIFEELDLGYSWIFSFWAQIKKVTGLPGRFMMYLIPPASGGISAQLVLHCISPGLVQLVSGSMTGRTGGRDGFLLSGEVLQMKEINKLQATLVILFHLSPQNVHYFNCGSLNFLWVVFDCDYHFMFIIEKP